MVPASDQTTAYNGLEQNEKRDLIASSGQSAKDLKKVIAAMMEHLNGPELRLLSLILKLARASAEAQVEGISGRLPRCADFKLEQAQIRSPQAAI